MASSGGPEAEFDDPHRKELLQDLHDTLPENFSPTAWACLWLSDIDLLENMVAVAKLNPLIAKGALLNVQSAKIVPTWTQRNRVASNASTPSQRPFTPLQPSPVQQSPSAQGGRGQKRTISGQQVITRSKIQRDLCHERDQKKCVLTDAGEPNEIAHIFPFSLRYEDDTITQQSLSFWDILRIFWSKERVDTWYHAIFSTPARTEVCQNLLCLCPNAHAYWKRAFFVLKPIRISDDKKRLDVQFFWLSSNSHVPTVDILQVPSLLASDQGPNSTRLFNNKTCTIIKSGDEISLKTDDPVLWPLPDFKLLEMQWFLHRVTAMSGAAEAQDDSHDDSDDDIATALQDRWDMHAQDNWDMVIEEVPASEHFEEGRSLIQHFEEGRSLIQHFEVHTFGHMVTLRGGEEHREREDHKEDDHEEPD